MQNGVLSTLDLWVCQYVTVSNMRPIKVSDLKVGPADSCASLTALPHPAARAPCRITGTPLKGDEHVPGRTLQADGRPVRHQRHHPQVRRCQLAGLMLAMLRGVPCPLPWKTTS